MPNNIKTALLLLSRAEKQFQSLQRILRQLNRLCLPIYWDLPMDFEQKVSSLAGILQESKQDLLKTIDACHSCRQTIKKGRK